MPISALVISLDFELFWGVSDSRTHQEYNTELLNVHKIIPRLLELFEKYKVRATWAFVGFVSYENKDQLIERLPVSPPVYNNNVVNNYSFIRDHSALLEAEPGCFFYPDALKKIALLDGQELASHSYCHYFSKECVDTKSFTEDVALFNARFHELYGIYSQSYIFPRNQVNDTHLNILRENGYQCYRGPEHWSYSNNSFFRKVFRLADTYINISGSHSLPWDRIENNKLYNIRGSRFLKPVTGNKRFDHLRNRRVKNSMTAAAKRGDIFHLWWHPHNFGAQMELSFKYLEEIFRHYTLLKDQYGMLSLNMLDVVNKRKNDERVSK